MRALLPVLTALIAAACGDKPAVQEDTGPRDATVDGASDGADGSADGADGAADQPEFDAFDGYQASDVYGPGSDRPDLCQVVWRTTGRAASSTCDGCTWSFLVSGTFDPSLSDVGVCGDPGSFTVTWATDGETLFYEYGGGFVALAPVIGWSPDAEGYNFQAQRSDEDDGYTTVLTIEARVR